MKERPLDDIDIYDADDEDDEDFDDADDGTAEWHEPDLGPDARDMDLIDGSWEQRYYRGENRSRDWNAIVVGVSLIVLLSLVLPALLVFL